MRALPPQGFEGWLTSTLQEPTKADLREGARSFAHAVADSTFRQSKVAAAQVLAYSDKYTPQLTNDLFVMLRLVLLVKADELPAGEKAKEVALLQSGKLEVPAEIPRHVLDAIDTQKQAMATDLARSLGASDRKTASESQRSARTTAVDASVIAGLSMRQWGAFLGRTISDVFSPQEEQALAHLAARGRVDKALVQGLELSGASADRNDGGAWAQRTGAAIDLARRAQYEALDEHDRKALAIISATDPTPTMGYEPIRSLKDGDIEGLLQRWMRVSVPRLARAAVLHHPHIVSPDALVALSEQVSTLRAEQGEFLERFNVLTVMHQTAGVVPWLQALERDLGLQREDYMGVSVPYSGSPIAIARLNHEGFSTSDDHDPRDPLMRQVQDTLGSGNPRSFDELKEADITRAVGAMIKHADNNGKPILVIDDGGYVGLVIRKHYPEHEHRFRIVEWTTRGIRKFEQIDAPKFALLSAAESAPKTQLEPAFIADALRDACLVSMQNRLGTLRDKSLLLVGYGHIGRAVALAMQEKGMRVTVSDRSQDVMNAAAKDGFAIEPNISNAVKNKNAILAATGANSLPPDVFANISHGTVIASASSVDIETRSDRASHNGTWGKSLVRRELRVENGETTAIDRELIGGGYVLNMTRRTRLMAPEREELIFMNVTEALGQIATTEAPGKHMMTKEREQRIESLYAKHRPQAFRVARGFG